ncbi:MAG: hypothetical protein M3O35_13325 [Acidobacteriota bacterium]|nr:hypothetical protein [Acidobacteriota bacterium]
MNWKRYAITVLVVLIAAHITGFVIHAIILADDYKALVSTKLYSSPEQFQSRAAFLTVAYLAFAVGAVWIYAKGVEAGPWIPQGVRFGIAVWLVMAVPAYVIEYAVQPAPGMLTAKQLFWDFLNKILLGVVTAALYRRPARP